MANKVLSRHRLQTMAQCAIFAAILCILSPISVPIGPIPISLGAFAVMLTGIVLGWKKGAVSVLVYLLLGLCGLPVFAGWVSGMTALPGPTGGYLWSFLPMAAIIGCLSARPARNQLLAVLFSILACIPGIAVCYFLGTLQYVLLTGSSWQAALPVCVVPFIPFDCLKAVCAAAVGVPVRELLHKAGYLS